MAKRRMSTFERLESGRLNRKQRRELERQRDIAIGRGKWTFFGSVLRYSAPRLAVRYYGLDF